MAVRQFKKIAIGCDHAGFPAKAPIIEFLEKQGCEVVDMGCFDEDPHDYPVFAFKAAGRVQCGIADGAILICGTGIGMSKAANIFPGCSATLVYNENTAESSRKHNNSNVLCLGARQFAKDELIRFVEIWLITEFEGGRHEHRLKIIRDREKAR